MGESSAAGGNILYATVAQGASLDCVEESHRIDSLARESALIEGHCSGFQTKAHVDVPKAAPLREQSDSRCRFGGNCHAKPRPLSHGVAIFDPRDFGDQLLENRP